MKNTQIIALYNILDNKRKTKITNFSYGVEKNLSILEKDINVFKEIYKPSSEFLEYDNLLKEKQLELCKKHARKDEKGKPISKIEQVLDANNKVIGEKTKYDIEDLNKFGDELKEEKSLLDEKYKEVIDIREKQIIDANKIIEDGETEISVFKIKSVYLPSDLDADEIKALSPVLED